MAETFHPISALLLFNVFQSLLALEGSLQSGEQIFKQEKMPRVADRLSIIHPCLGATQHPYQAQGQLSLFTGSIGISQNEISGGKRQ